MINAIRDFLAFWFEDRIVLTQERRAMFISEECRK